MSVIAWDGKTLAADKRAVRETLIHTCTKIFRVRCVRRDGSTQECLLGYCGFPAGGEEMVYWFKNGADPEKFPASQRASDGWQGLLVITPRLEVLKFENSPFPFLVEDTRFGVGCARDIVTTAMYLGKTAKEAVEIACILDNGCGNGIDTLSFS